MRFPRIKAALLISFTLLVNAMMANVQHQASDKPIAVTLRMIGHQILLEADDSTSRVLPIEREVGAYRINFETSFDIQPDELVPLIDSLVRYGEIAQSYRVEILTCDSNEVVYGYEMGRPGSKVLVPCLGRQLPIDCYSILFTIVEPLPGPLVGEASGRKLASGSPAGHLPLAVFASLLIVTTGLWFYFRRRSQSRSNQNLLALGSFAFDARNMELNFKGETTELTTKEADLLLLLYNFSNTTLEREFILNRVWSDGGDYVGRTLDVFISKLRKKLEADPALKIVNVRGVGYKLVVNE